VCVCVCSKYDGPSVPWDDVPDVPRDGIRRSSHIGPPERRHLQPEPRPTPATACGCRLRDVSVCCAPACLLACLPCLPACLKSVHPPLNICSRLFVFACVSQFTLSVLLCAASIWHGFCNSRPIRPERVAALFVVCQFSGMCYLNDAIFFVSFFHF
jgi:hypothetical protein